MADIIHGVVNSIIDEDSFIISVTKADESNEYKYKKWECVKILNITGPSLKDEAASFAQHLLTDSLKGKNIRCSVHSKDDFGRIEASVEVI